MSGRREGRGPQEGQRIMTELGVSGDFSENKSQVCHFTDVNQIMAQKFLKKNVD